MGLYVGLADGVYVGFVGLIVGLYVGLTDGVYLGVVAAALHVCCISVTRYLLPSCNIPIPSVLRQHLPTSWLL